jgi:hypothetical protein
LDIKCERHGTYFAPGVEDTAWLPKVGEKHWALLTCDQRLRYNQLEIAKIIEYRVRSFFYTSGNLSGPMMAEILGPAIPKMKRLFKKCTPPFIATISKSGNVILRYDSQGSVHDRKKKAKENEANQDSA